MNVSLFVALIIAIPAAICCHLHTSTYGVANYLTLSIICFLVVNIVICVWELALFYRFDEITTVHNERLVSGFYKNCDEGRSNRSKVALIFFKDVPFAKQLSLRTWTHIWIDYCRFDTSYQDPTTFGYCIDVGNGHSTFFVSILYLYSMIYPIWQPKIMGMVGLILFYQKLYGTVIYLFSFFNNKRYVNLTWSELLLAVISTNIVWFIFPAMGIYANAEMIMNDSYSIFQ